MLESVLANGSFYYSDGHDLTRNLQLQHGNAQEEKSLWKQVIFVDPLQDLLFMTN